MALVKLLVTIAIATAITIAVITTKTTTNTVAYTSSDAPGTQTIRPSRFLAQKEVGERKANAADHCNKDPEICSLYGGGGSNSTVTCCNKCIDVASDDKNCGACKNKCKFSQTCCRGQCIYLSYDKRHCGQCNHPCEMDELCVYGLCNKTEDLARVIPTFTRRELERKPISPLSLTHENIATSFSLPWNPSTVLISTTLSASLPNTSLNRSLKVLTW